MKTITINASKTYDVTIGPGLVSDIGKHILAIKGNAAALLSVTAMYGPYMVSK